MGSEGETRELDNHRTASGERESAVPRLGLGSVVAVNVSLGGVPKMRVTGATVAQSGLVGDAQNDKKHHGGPERAVCIFALERIRDLQAEGHPIDIGTAGENLTIEGIDWGAVEPGALLRVGPTVVLEIASYTNPCKTIKGSFIGGKFIRIAQKLHPGWSRVYARVLAEGEVRDGDAVELTSAPK